MIIFAVAAVIGFVAAAPPTYFGIREEPMEEEEESGVWRERVVDFPSKRESGEEGRRYSEAKREATGVLVAPRPRPSMFLHVGIVFDRLSAGACSYLHSPLWWIRSTN